LESSDEGLRTSTARLAPCVEYRIRPVIKLHRAAQAWEGGGRSREERRFPRPFPFSLIDMRAAVLRLTCAGAHFLWLARRFVFFFSVSLLACDHPLTFSLGVFLFSFSLAEHNSTE
jgi:hypothetical protein